MSQPLAEFGYEPEPPPVPPEVLEPPLDPPPEPLVELEPPLPDVLLPEPDEPLPEVLPVAPEVPLAEPLLPAPDPDVPVEVPVSELPAVFCLQPAAPRQKVAPARRAVRAALIDFVFMIFQGSLLGCTLRERWERCPAVFTIVPGIFSRCRSARPSVYWEMGYAGVGSPPRAIRGNSSALEFTFPDNV